MSCTLFLLTPANGHGYGKIALDFSIVDYNKFPIEVDGNGCHAQEGDKEEVVQ